ncbi:ABC transporter permease [Derxia gummosa]|uniref:ABC transporter permease n=1 Tax=Derxia gummosa DSM 723 TaxID=1121388 RepID=A0A8B6X5V3_9BURK|nr:ABC transporter permease [Derxia gummosa]
MELLDLVSGAAFWVAVLRLATPLLFGTLGALLCERSGVLNLGIEGIMVAGAFCGWLAAHHGAGPWGGLAAALLAGALLGLLHGLLTVVLALSQHVAGLGLTMLATSLSYFSYRVAFPQDSGPPAIAPFARFGAEAPLLDSVPVLGQLTAPTVLAFLLVPLTAWLLNRTPLGLAIRMCGENPDAAEAQGLSVIGIRLLAVAAGSALMALGGAFLTLSAFDAFFFNMVNGRGWICIALVVFASWRPGKAMLGTLLFGAFDALQISLQSSPSGLGGLKLPYQLYLMAPYLLSITALALAGRRAQVPQALMKPWRKGER